jgi:hypothetical protein
MPFFDAPTSAIPLDFLPSLGPRLDRQIGQQHPVQRFTTGRGAGSWTQTACKVSGGQLFFGPTAGGWIVIEAQRISTVAVRAG